MALAAVSPPGAAFRAARPTDRRDPAPDPIATGPGPGTRRRGRRVRAPGSDSAGRRQPRKKNPRRSDPPGAGNPDTRAGD